MKLTRHLTPIASACTVALGLAVSAPASAGGLLKAAVADWTGGAVMCEIIHTIVEQELDYKVKRIVMPYSMLKSSQLVCQDLRPIHCRHVVSEIAI